MHKVQHQGHTSPDVLANASRAGKRAGEYAASQGAILLLIDPKRKGWVPWQQTTAGHRSKSFKKRLPFLEFFTWHMKDVLVERGLCATSPSMTGRASHSPPCPQCTCSACWHLCHLQGGHVEACSGRSAGPGAFQRTHLLCNESLAGKAQRE